MRILLDTLNDLELIIPSYLAVTAWNFGYDVSISLLSEALLLTLIGLRILWRASHGT